MKRRRGPVRHAGDRFVIDLGHDERSLIRRLLAELRELLSDPEPPSEARVLLVRLFPVAHPDDEEAEAEYQRLMRDELVQSKLEAIERVDEVLSEAGKGGSVVDEEGLLAFMQAINSIRLVLGTMLAVTDDPDLAAEHDGVADGLDDSPEYHLYAYLSWLLEHCVRMASPS